MALQYIIRDPTWTDPKYKRMGLWWIDTNAYTNENTIVRAYVERVIIYLAETQWLP